MPKLTMNYVAKAAGTDVPKMIYQNFGASMTAWYAVVCDNWPLEQFCSPSSLGSHTELKVLYHAFKTRTVRFWKLTEQEFEQWESDRFNAVLAQTTAHNDDTISQQAGSDELLAIPTPLQPIGGVKAHVTPASTQAIGSIEAHATPASTQAITIPAPLQQQLPTPISTPLLAGPLQTNIVNIVTRLDGTGIQAPSWPRKTCKDKGQLRKKMGATA